MSLAKIPSAVVDGISAQSVQVEVDVTAGLPGFTVVGLADKAVEESRERVRSAIKNIGFKFPLARITVHLAPSDHKKTGLHFDLPIALGILQADKQIKEIDQRHETLFIGGISLDGQLQAIQGSLVLVEWAKANKFKNVVLPVNNLHEARLVKGINLIGAEHFNQVLQWLAGTFEGVEPNRRASVDRENVDLDWLQIQGQHQAKRAAIIAASGAHNLLLEGPPGAGKTLLARGLRALLPPLTSQEAVEVIKLHSIAGELHGDQLIDAINRPFRSPHHTSSQIALVGGGPSPRPGEISLAHNGILFLDEIPEFPRSVIEALRQPLEDGRIHVSRASRTLVFPAQFQLVATMNPCPCGYLNSNQKECICSPHQIVSYRKRLSGPILDRIDLYLRIPSVKLKELQSTQTDIGELERIRELIVRSRDIQRRRNGGVLNSRIPASELNKIVNISQSSQDLLEKAAERFIITGRGYHRLLKLSRTIADLESAAEVLPTHVAEALHYRMSQE